MSLSEHEHPALALESEGKGGVVGFFVRGDAERLTAYGDGGAADGVGVSAAVGALASAHSVAVSVQREDNLHGLAMHAVGVKAAVGLSVPFLEPSIAAALPAVGHAPLAAGQERGQVGNFSRLHQAVCLGNPKCGLVDSVLARGERPGAHRCTESDRHHPHQQ